LPGGTGAANPGRTRGASRGRVRRVGRLGAAPRPRQCGGNENQARAADAAVEGWIPKAH